MKKHSVSKRRTFLIFIVDSTVFHLKYIFSSYFLLKLNYKVSLQLIPSAII